MSETTLTNELTLANLKVTMKERDWAIKLLKDVVSLPDDCEKTCAEYENIRDIGCDLNCEDCGLERCPCWKCTRTRNWVNWNMKAPPVGWTND